MRDLMNTYFMDDRREAGRLESKVNAPAFVEKYLEPFLHPETGAILEVGCGPGMFLEVLARKYPGVSIKGIDISADRIGIARHRLAGLPSAEALQASVYHLPFPDRYFDFIYSRFLFEYLNKPVEAARELFRVCKPGGLLFLQDLDNQFSFYPALSDKLQACLEQLKEINGFDPEIGRKLYSIGKAAGFSPLSGEVEAYHQVWGAANEDTMRQWQLKLDIAFKNLDASLGSKCTGLKEEMLQSLQSADSVMYSTVFSVAFRKE